MKMTLSASGFLLAVIAAGSVSGGIASSPQVSSGDGETSPAMPMPTKPYAEFVAPGDSLSPLRFFDGDQVSLNDRCPVRKVRLNPKMAPAYVNGQPVGFC